jgi:cytochrome c553
LAEFASDLGQSGEGATMNMKLFAAMALLFVGAASPLQADAQKPANAQDQTPANAQERYVPRLNDMMVATQLRHFKLWYAGLVQNWPLANYELAQIRNAIADTRRLYPNSGGSDMSTMMPPTDDLDDAIKAKDSAKFSNAFSKLTAACNSCHEATGFAFIKIREPRLSPLETSPFTDESFSGK